MDNLTGAISWIKLQRVFVINAFPQAILLQPVDWDN